MRWDLVLLLAGPDETGNPQNGPDEGKEHDKDAAHPKDGEERPDPRAERAKRLLAEAIRRREEEQQTGRETSGMKVDKYFGSKLPPVCARLGCYVTDDGKRFYCVNASCQKHKKRETKHTRRGRPSNQKFVYFRCPRCESKRVEMNVFANTYHCKTCKHTWEK